MLGLRARRSCISVAVLRRFPLHPVKRDDNTRAGNRTNCKRWEEGKRNHERVVAHVVDVDAVVVLVLHITDGNLHVNTGKRHDVVLDGSPAQADTTLGLRVVYLLVHLLLENATLAQPHNHVPYT